MPCGAAYKKYYLDRQQIHKNLPDQYCQNFFPSYSTEYRIGNLHTVPIFPQHQSIAFPPLKSTFSILSSPKCFPQSRQFS